MIAFALPWLFALGVAASLGVVALHFLSVRQPPELLLPTARFLDEGQVRALSRSARPSDVLLLILRVLALLLVCAALAGPRWASGSRSTMRLVVADVAMRADSAALLSLVDFSGSGGAVRFVWSGASTDSGRVGAAATGMPRGIRIDLTAALPMALRAAASVATELPDVDSLSLYVVTPPPMQVNADSWRAWRATWPGAVHVRSMPTASRAGGTDSLPQSRAQLRFDTTGVDARVDDPVRAALAMRTADISQSITVQRADVERESIPPPGPAPDVTILWPVSGVPRGWRAVSDTSSALVANGVASVAAWPRSAMPTEGLLRDARAIAWWGDGLPAAIEVRKGASCVREVGVAVAASSDLLLDANATGFMTALLAPCGDMASGSGVLAERLDSGRGAAAYAARFRAEEASHLWSLPRWLTPVLLALALLVLLAEWLLRDREVART